VRVAINGLIANAIEAGGEVTIRTRRESCTPATFEDCYLSPSLEGGDYAALTVSDTGPGIAEGVRDRIFEPFFTTKFTGRGLGLAALHGIVRSHRGAVRVESAAGKGSAFTVYFPLSPDA
jgi:signal transduction histidine kinase